MPERIETSLLVLEQFRDPGGREWRPGDRAPLRYRNVRLAATQRPELFVMEYETASVDMAWLAEIDAKYDAQFERAKRARDECSGRALREEFETPKATRNAKAGRGAGSHRRKPRARHPCASAISLPVTR
jgi:hypothetical protein